MNGKKGSDKLLLVAAKGISWQLVPTEIGQSVLFLFDRKALRNLRAEHFSRERFIPGELLKGNEVLHFAIVADSLDVNSNRQARLRVCPQFGCVSLARAQAHENIRFLQPINFGLAPVEL